MTQWEYQTLDMDYSVTFRSPEGDKNLNSYGKEGWELVGMTYNDTDMGFIFKRPIKVEKDVAINNNR